MSNNPNLVEIISELGQPPEGVDLETYAIAQVDPSELRPAIRTVTPTYEQLRRIKDENPDLYQNITANPQPEWNLGETILLKQQRLSRPRRLVATAMVSLTLATGMGALAYEAKEEVRKDYPSISKKDEILTSAAAGGIAGVAGGFITYLSSFGFTGRLARRPAKRIVRRAEQKPA